MKDWTVYEIKEEHFEDFKYWYKRKFGREYLAKYYRYLVVYNKNGVCYASHHGGYSVDVLFQPMTGFERLVDGQKITRKLWDNNSYIYVEDGEIRFVNCSKDLEINALSLRDWVEYKELTLKNADKTKIYIGVNSGAEYSYLSNYKMWLRVIDNSCNFVSEDILVKPKGE